MRISVVGKDKVLISSVFHNCSLEIFWVSYPIDLLPIPMGDASVIVQMNWLSRFGD